ncbi:MAG: septum formation protein Maf [Firmicutes bacterium]|nr:septum formation protein Maf [Bacillota bacterium]
MLVLASTSPRRRELLQGLGIDFKIQVKDVPENFPPGMKASRVVELLSERKARAVAVELNEGLVIGSDTIVTYNDEILGKPEDSGHAKEMLKKLQGTYHYVYSGVAVINAFSGKVAVSHQCTRVKIKPLTDNEIDKYIASGEPKGKAGAYAIQGIASLFIEGIEGCYFNVVGLPIKRLADLLKEFDYDVLESVVNQRSQKSGVSSQNEGF